MPLVKVEYFAVLREQRSLSDEMISTAAATPAELYEELKSAHSFTLPLTALRCAINDEFASMEQRMEEGDVVAFIAPVAGG